MFALEIGFNDGVSRPESMLVRRPVVTLGASDNANIVIDDLANFPFQIQIIRGLGQRFSIKKIPLPDAVTESVVEIEGAHNGSASLNLGSIRLHITALDIDLQPKEQEAPDKAGVRILRLAAELPTPIYPAVQIEDYPEATISFHENTSVLTGRSNRCAVRVDAPDVSNKHARIGFERGEFWIEDLGSTNGTFVNEQQISGRLNVPAGARVKLGRSTTLRCAKSSLDLKGEVDSYQRGAIQETHVQFPALIALSDLVRPTRIIFGAGSKIVVGRDPTSDLWIGAPHISRRHCTISFPSTSTMDVIDTSTNGTKVNGELIKNSERKSIVVDGSVVDLGEGVVIGVCSTAEQEQGLISWFSVGMPSSTALNNGEVVGRTENSQDKERQRLLTVQIFGNRIVERVKHPLGIFRTFADMFKRADPIGRLLFMVFCLLLILVVAVVFALLLPVFIR